MRTCDHAQDLLAKQAAEALTEQEQAFIDSHLTSCATCREHEATIHRFIAGLKALGEVHLEPSPTLRQAILEQMGERAPARSAGRVRRRSGSSRHRIRALATRTRAEGADRLQDRQEACEVRRKESGAALAGRVRLMCLPERALTP